MKLLFIGILIILVGYQPSVDKRSIIHNKTIITRTADSSLNLKIEYPLAVEYTNSENSDTIFFCIEHNRLLVTPKGDVIIKNELLFEIYPEGNIQKIFPFIIGEDIVIIYSFSTLDGDSGSTAKRISLKNKNIIWKTSIYGFNLVRPIIVNGYVYLSTIGFVGKLSVKTGEFIWGFDDFFKNGNFISFNEPLFYKDSIVQFTENKASNLIGSSITIDDRNRRILTIKQ
ncbi:MAG: hypothetical protein EHM93_19445 [Bacteroidales bacterium]|nr:MAG: hypothetical protein EHM93_19445 [Bacteroidales bacterium]